MEVEAAYSLPTPTDTPYRTPSSSRSRRSREFDDMSPVPTPPPDVADGKMVRRRSSEMGNAALSEKISPLDPRRFTPTLHANLVSEILSLRRDLESKTKNIDQLEQSLQQSQSFNDGLNKSLLASNKEVRSVRRQMQLLEGGTLSALNDLSKERDDAMLECVDLRSRLEKIQKRAKHHEENADRTQALWDKEKDAWGAEKRALETRVHIVEGRLKVVIGELAKVHEAPVDSGLSRSQSRSSVRASPVKRPLSEIRERRQSGASITSDHAGGRTSVLSFEAGVPTNLADELALDDIDEGGSDASEDERQDIDDDDAGRVSPDALPEERGRPASSLSIKARKILGLPFDIEDMAFGERAQSVADAWNLQDMQSKSASQNFVYVDAGVQYSQPGTPAPIDVSEGEHTAKSADNRDLISPDDSAGNSELDSQSRNMSVVTPRPVMVSSSCQTIESLPSPPLTPKQNEKALATIPESAFERVETKTMATQTERSASPEKQYHYRHSRTDTDDLAIPVIAIIPPASRPVTPETSIKLPPRTKNAGCQVQTEVLLNYTSTSMQTEEIKIDRRYLLEPDLMSDVFVAPQTQTAKSRPKSHVSSRQRGQAVSNSALKRSAPPVPAMPPINDDGPLTRDISTSKARPVRSSSLFAGFEEQADDLDHELEDDMFVDDDQDDDVFNRPIAKYSLRAGKLVSQERSLEDIREMTAKHAGEALALETLRQSEDALPLEYRGQAEAMARAKALKRSTSVRRGQSVTKPGSMRKAAMISNGTAAHQHKHSISTVTSSEGGGSAPPPIPVPLRYSSARLGKSFSEGGRSSRSSSNASPTRQGRRVVKPALRKARSGPALSPSAATRRQRSTSPPVDARVSIVPEMPVFQMPDPSPLTPVSLINVPAEASAPRPSVATGPGREGYHNKANSDAPLLHQTSVVDAIAQTMVGEWMYKYVRRRKSFGKPDKDWDPSKSADELINNSGSAGVRHKRWVWVAPYERAVMWSSKQPMSGTALMGKTGRKLTIKSVLDVKDDNPMPKNSLTGPQFNRSILILTPQRALKFTATNQERHYVWLTALSFLSHSPLSLGDLAALPPPSEEPANASPALGGSFRRRNIRDSIRIAKAPNRPTVDQRSFTTDGIPGSEFYDQRPATQDTFDTNHDAAAPPIVRRYHTRNRSNTAPKAPPSAFKSFSLRDPVPSLPTSSYSQSVVTGSSERGPYTPSLGHPSIPSTRRGSEASALGRPGVKNFLNFDSNSSHNASMTMRMDAFIDNKPASKGGQRDSRISQGARGFGVGHGRRQDPAHWSFDENGMPSLGPVVDMALPHEVGLRFNGHSTSIASTAERDYFRNF